MKNEIIKKLNKANLTGRGGGCFPTATKWEFVKKAPGDRKYVICNCSEGEPGIHKDKHILENHADAMIHGMNLAIEYLDAEKGYIYLNPTYHRLYSTKLNKAVKGTKISLFKKDHRAGYVGGEETSAINHIEGYRVEPRLRPPFPPQSGLWDCPTLVNNVETFYHISLIEGDIYEGKRFYTINGDCLWTGVSEGSETDTIEKVLKDTRNYPDFDFFVQVGGNASGTVLAHDQLDRPVGGAGSITVMSMLKHEPMDLIRDWAKFFHDESCGQCTPCREGTHRLVELLGQKKVNWNMVADVMTSLAETSFCGLGCAAPIAIDSYVENVLSRDPESRVSLPEREAKMICECFS